MKVKHSHLEVPERGGGRGGDESAQPCPLSVSADPLPTEDTPTGEPEPDSVISPTPSTGDYSNGDANSSSVVGGAGKSQQEKSVLIRLSNRVRDLEENMSLFTSYLDQLSTRWEERGRGCVCACVFDKCSLTVNVLCCHGYSMKKNKNKTEEINRKLTLLGEQLGELRIEVGGTSVCVCVCTCVCCVQAMCCAVLYMSSLSLLPAGWSVV